MSLAMALTAATEVAACETSGRRVGAPAHERELTTARAAGRARRADAMVVHRSRRIVRADPRATARVRAAP
jgi:hypothetical protein